MRHGSTVRSRGRFPSRIAGIFRDVTAESRRSQRGDDYAVSRTFPDPATDGFLYYPRVGPAAFT